MNPIYHYGNSWIQTTYYQILKNSLAVILSQRHFEVNQL